MNKVANQFIEAVSKYNSIVIYIPGSPDPDALASACAIKVILVYHSIESDIYAEKKLSLPQNKAFIKHLKLPVFFDRPVNIKKYEAYIVPDFQSNRVEKIDKVLPCAAHFDHHGKSNDAVKADFSLIRTDVGATSTLLALILKSLNLELSEKDMIQVATALTFGIQTDTDKYNNIKSLDIRALSFLSEYADLSILQSLNSMPPSPATLESFDQAMANEVIYKDWGFYGIGYIDSRDRDSIAMAADMILKGSEQTAIAVFAAVENYKKSELYLDVSLRTSSNKIDLNSLIKRITTSGGGRRYKGAYQVKLDYFLNAPDKAALWNLIEETTVEALKKSRDTIYLTGIETIYDNIKSGLASLLKK